MSLSLCSFRRYFGLEEMYLGSKILKMFLVAALVATGVGAQEPSQTDENLNFNYSQNPPAKSINKADREYAAGNERPENNRTRYFNIVTAVKPADESKRNLESVANLTRWTAKSEAVSNLKPTEFYKVGPGDVLYVSLQGSKSNYYTVLHDGSIDYPLAGGVIKVSGLSVGAIEDLLRTRVRLYENPEVTVNVREYASHRIDVLGMVGISGKHYLQREALPLFVIRAQSLAESGADIAVLRRANGEELTFKVGTPEFDAALVYAGDVVEFTSSASRHSRTGFIFVGGYVDRVGRIDFFKGITLTQAIFAAGGVTGNKGNIVTVRRNNDRGFLESKTYKLSEIRTGAAVDPVLEAGDLIEVGT